MLTPNRFPVCLLVILTQLTLQLAGCSEEIQVSDGSLTNGTSDPAYEAKGGTKGRVKATPTPTPTPTQPPPVNSGNGLVRSSFLGGSGDEFIYGVTSDSAGNVYLAGETNSANFPVTSGAFQTAPRGFADAFVVKVDSAGVRRWATLIGGMARDVARAVAVDASGNVFITGETSSTDFPVTAGAFQIQKTGSSTGFVVKLSPAGDRLISSTFLGGSSYTYPRAIAVDSSGNVLVAGYTGCGDFPTTPGVVKSSRSGGSLYDPSDGFVTKLNAAMSALVYSTYLGGNGADALSRLALDPSGGAVVCGNTQSSDFPVTAGALRTSYGGMRDAVVARLNPSATGYVYSTYLGGSSVEDCTALRVDSQGNAYVSGYSMSPDFPVTSAAYQRAFSGGTIAYDAFVSKLPPSGSPLVYSTFVGGAGNDMGCDLILRADGSAVVAGAVAGGGFPVTSGAFSTVFQGGNADGILFRISPDGSALPYSTYLGSAGNDVARGITLLPDGRIAMVGDTNGTGFPVTSGADDTTFNGGNDGFLSVFALP